MPTDLAEVYEGVEVVGARKQRPDGGPGGGWPNLGIKKGQNGTELDPNRAICAIRALGGRARAVAALGITPSASARARRERIARQ